MREWGSYWKDRAEEEEERAEKAERDLNIKKRRVRDLLARCRKRKEALDVAERERDEALDRVGELEAQLDKFTNLQATLKRARERSENSDMKEFIEQEGMLSAYSAWKEANDILFFDKVERDLKEGEV